MTAEEFYPYIRLALGTSEDACSQFPTEELLDDLRAVAKAQGVQGVLFAALDRMDTSRQKPNPKSTPAYGRLIAAEWQIENITADHTVKTGKLSGRFSGEGRRSCLLKGVGLGTCYDENVRRQPGDIDLWVEGSRESTLEFLQGRWKVSEVVYHHCDVAGLSKPNVEFHFTPSWMFNHSDNRRLQAWFASKADAQFSHKVNGLDVAVPTLDFNLVFIPIHFYRHLFDEGVKLKQLVDCFFLLKNASDSERAEALSVLESIHAGKFAAGLMYVLGEALGMPREWMLCRPDKRIGTVILSELEKYLYSVTPIDKNEGFLHRVCRRGIHRWGLLTCFPREVLAAPVFKTVQYLWRLKNGYFAKN